jgi:hypothetical protein
VLPPDILQQKVKVLVLLKLALPVRQPVAAFSHRAAATIRSSVPLKSLV